MEHNSTLSDTENDTYRSRDAIQKKITYVLTKINTEEKQKFRQNLSEAISDCDDGNELVVIFKKHLIDDDHLQGVYSHIYSDLQKLNGIRQYTIEPYESVVNGFSFTKNNIDLHIYSLSSQDIPEIGKTITGMIEGSKQFSNVSSYFRFPIIKCDHLETGFSLNINISRPNDIHNSEFINQIKQADKSIYELMLFLKIWFKNMFIYTDEYISKYCLMTLIIFYLQNTQPPILASIKILQQNAQKSIINGINFGMNSRCIPMNLSQSVHDMIKGFFEFYSSVDFENVIIAPYLGKVIKKTDFQKKIFDYPEYEAQLRMLSASSNEPTEELNVNCLICVQDMFYLNRNIAQDVSNINVRYLNKCITMAHKKCCEAKMSIKNLYKSLLVDIIDELVQMVPKNELATLAFEIFPRDNELKAIARFVDQPLNIKKLWAKAYIVAIPQIINAVYKIDITLLPPTENCKIKKIDETDELPLPCKWSISTSLDLWTGRKIARCSMSFMADQLAQTEKLYVERRQTSNYAVKLKGFITITITKDFNSLYIEASSNDFLQIDLGKFFASLKWYMRTYSLRHRIHLLESQLQKNI